MATCDSDFLHNIPAEEEKKNFWQRQCPECGEWVVWVLKDTDKRSNRKGLPRWGPKWTRTPRGPRVKGE